MRNIPDNNLAYPTLITWNTGSSGSGFLLNSGTHIYLITAKHVLFNENGTLRGASADIICQTANVDDDTTYIYNVDFTKLAPGLIFKHANADISAFTFGTVQKLPEGAAFITHPSDGIVNKQPGKSELVTANASDSIRFIKDVLISNDIYLYGYPSSLGLKQSPQFDYDKPLLRKGIIASLNKKQNTVILDCPVYYGNSGGPVVQVTRSGLGFKHDIIGVVSQFIPYVENWKNLSNGLLNTELSNSGYSVAVAMDSVIEMLGLQVKVN